MPLFGLQPAPTGTAAWFWRKILPEAAVALMADEHVPLSYVLSLYPVDEYFLQDGLLRLLGGAVPDSAGVQRLEREIGILLNRYGLEESDLLLTRAQRPVMHLSNDEVIHVLGAGMHFDDTGGLFMSSARSYVLRLVQYWTNLVAGWLQPTNAAMVSALDEEMGGAAAAALRELVVVHLQALVTEVDGHG